MLSFIKSIFGVEASLPLDHDLVARIRDNLKREPSDHLHTMLDPAGADKWSREAVHAARLLLEQRAQNLAPSTPASCLSAWRACRPLQKRTLWRKCCKIMVRSCRAPSP